MVLRISKICLCIIALTACLSYADMLGRWTFDNASSPWEDISGAGNDGNVLAGGVTRSTDAAAGSGSAQFDGSSGCLYLCSPRFFKGDFTQGKATMSMWLKLDTANPTTSKTGLGNLDNWALPTRYASSGSTMQSSIFLSHPAGLSFTLPAGVNRTQWHHLAVTVNTDNLQSGYKIYINAQLAASYPMDGTYGNFIGLQTPRLGSAYNMATNTWYWFDGKIDDVRIYNEALSSSEINSLYCGEWNLADLNTDCTVNIDDIKLFAENWLNSSPAIGDLNNSGRVEFADFAIIAESWLSQKP